MMKHLESLRQEPSVAYFSMELALRQELPTYSGGLGVLAGDVVRTAADLGLPFLAITQLSRKGYLRQRLDDDGTQHDEPSPWNPADHLELLPVRATVTIQGRPVIVQVWGCECASVVGRPVPVLFVDTDLPENHPDDRPITAALYGGDLAYRLKQEIVLGIGGARILRALDLPIRKYHINEGHSALIALELLSQSKAEDLDARLREVREVCVFTTHTPVEAGQDRFSYVLVQEILGEMVPAHVLRRLGGEAELNMTLLALNTSGYVNGVAERHREVSAALFPRHVIHAITNGVHSHTWTSPSFQRLFDAYIPGWAAEPLLLARVDAIPDFKILQAHLEAKRALIELVRTESGVDLDEVALTIGFARRFTRYKRPGLIFSDMDRLRRLTERGPIQIVFAGKAHPRDDEGKSLIRDVFRAKSSLAGDIRIAYLPDYDLEMAKKLVAGVDVWLNTPEVPLEASGTSGMKAAHNGVINFSVLDGWWIEGHLEGVTGWSIGPSPKEKGEPAARRQREIDDLYGKLEYVILPTYYQRPGEWVRMMKESIDDLASYFNSHRMLRRYVTDAYYPRGQ